MSEKRSKLRNLMSQLDIKCNDVALILNVKLNTVQIWASRHQQDIPDRKLRELEIAAGCAGMDSAAQQ